MSIVGELVASSVVKEVTTTLTSALWEQIGLHWGFTDDMDDMIDNLNIIQEVLDDAERRSITTGLICRWLKDLKSAAYDIEDMMCDFETNISINNGRIGWAGMVQKILYSPKMAIKRFSLVNQMKEMRERLDKIAKKRSNYGLTAGGSEFDENKVVAERKRISTVDNSMVLGRDKEKAYLISLVTDESVSIIAIVGLGGIGKTTLARLIYNDACSFFDLKAWVYVSLKFDLENIGKTLLKSFGESSQEIPEDLGGISKNLKCKINGKKYFIVFDDLWEENGSKLEELRQMLHGGCEGSKIIVTTRREKVAKQIQASRIYELGILSNDWCWELFSQRAFTSLIEKDDTNLERVGREIVKKCGGVPLAVIALGYTMQSKKGINAWSKVRDSGIWDLKENNASAILPSLKLSYYFMPSYLKLCFGYCAIFPKGCEILKSELIQQWIALGFIPPMDTETDIRLEMHGEEYVDDLLGMSFLQVDTFTRSKFRMHDLVHDLARSIIGNELLILDAKRNNSNHAAHHGRRGHDYRYALLLNFEGLTNENWSLLKKMRAIRCHDCTFGDSIKENKINFSCLTTKNKKKFTTHGLLHAKYLRVLHLHFCRLTTFPNSVKKLKQLRYLSAQATGLKVLPKSFGELINLRYLDMSSSLFGKLPASFGDLTNLQVLNLGECSELRVLPEPFNLLNLQELYLQFLKNLRKLPDSISSLRELRILDISWCKSFYITTPFVAIVTRLSGIKMDGCPYHLSLGNMHHAPTPTSFILVKENNSHLYKIVDLNNTDPLEKASGSLEVACLENVRDPNDIVNLSFHKTHELETVKLRWTYPSYDRSIKEITQDKSILEHFKPHERLNHLILDGYSAPNFPSWLMNITDFLPNLSSLDLRNMEKLDQLPPLGLLSNLSDLVLFNMPSLTDINTQLFGGTGAFRGLRCLTLDSLLKLKEWPTTASDGEFVFTNLEWLQVYNCRKLRFKSSFPGSRQLRIKTSPHLLYSEVSQRSFLAVTRELQIISCEMELGTLPASIQSMTSLEILEINYCDNLTELPEWLGKLITLKRLEIVGCMNLNNLPLSVLDLPSITDVCMYGCNQTLVDQCSLDSRFIISEGSFKDHKDILFGAYAEAEELPPLCPIRVYRRPGHEQVPEQVPSLPTNMTVHEEPFQSTVASYTNPVTHVSDGEITHIVSGDPQQPSDGVQKLTTEEKGKGLLPTNMPRTYAPSGEAGPSYS